MCEEAALGGLLADVRGLAIAHEVIVADGGSSDATVAVARAAGARVVTCAASRGRQLAAGAAAARGTWLLFLHADARLDARAGAALAAAMAAPAAAAYAFRLRIDARRPAYRVLEWGANARSRLAQLPFGDQGLLLPRALYDAAGGFQAVPIMEDVLLVRRLVRLAPVRLLPASVTVSARRWEREGPARRTVHNWRLLFALWRGASPHHLAERYRPEPRRDR